VRKAAVQPDVSDDFLAVVQVLIFPDRKVRFPSSSTRKTFPSLDHPLWSARSVIIPPAAPAPGRRPLAWQRGQPL
jgi:hypothetical protein